MRKPERSFFLTEAETATALGHIANLFRHKDNESDESVQVARQFLQALKNKCFPLPRQVYEIQNKFYNFASHTSFAALLWFLIVSFMQVTLLNDRLSEYGLRTSQDVKRLIADPSFFVTVLVILVSPNFICEFIDYSQNKYSLWRLQNLSTQFTCINVTPIYDANLELLSPSALLNIYREVLGDKLFADALLASNQGALEFR